MLCAVLCMVLCVVLCVVLCCKSVWCSALCQVLCCVSCCVLCCVLCYGGGGEGVGSKPSETHQCKKQPKDNKDKETITCESNINETSTDT